MGSGIRNILIIQIIIVSVAAAVWFAAQGAAAAQGALLGGGLALLNSLLLARGVRQAGEAAAHGRTAGGMGSLYLGAMQRFVLTLVGFGVGIGLLGLPPVPLIVGFAAAQLGYVGGLRR